MGMKIIRGLNMPKPKGDSIKSTLTLMQVGDAVKADSKFQASYIRKVMSELNFKVTQRKIGDEVYLWRIE